MPPSRLTPITPPRLRSSRTRPKRARCNPNTFHERIGVTEWKLSNGARVLLKPTDFKNDQLLLRAFSPGGHSLVSDQQFVPASTASTVVGQSGLGAFNAIQLPKKLAGKIARVTAHIDSQFENVSGFASPADIGNFLPIAVPALYRAPGRRGDLPFTPDMAAGDYRKPA